MLRHSEMNNDTASLVCCVTLEWVNSQHSVVRKTNMKTVTITLLRNEFRELLLEVKNDKSKTKFHLKGVTVHKKFMAEGKASINFQEENMALLISNAPPSQLLEFLKAMYIKLCGEHTSGPKVGLRERLLSKKSQAVEEISPVTLQEEKRAKLLAGVNNTTPPSSKKRENNLESQFQKQQPAKRRCIPAALSPQTLTPEQKLVLEAALQGRNIFFTGSAGTGKSFLLQRIIGALPPDVTVATASTGVAACHIGGTTLHAFAGIGSGQGDLKNCIELARRPKVQQQWKKCHHLIIDEISMVDGPFFEKLEAVARAVRGNDKPFGGLQLILCGDFLQLPPVSRGSEKIKFCFQTAAWDRCVNAIFELVKVHRQSEQEFIDILQNVRIGRVTPEISARLAQTATQIIEGAGILATQLCSHTRDAQAINDSKLEALPGDSKTFVAVDSDSYSSQQLDQQTPVPSRLVLKVGTQVMLMKNVKIGEGLVNGARGVVSGFSEEGLPLVRFRSRREVAVKQERWVVKAGGGNLMTRKQIPLRLAWAFSIHKSQGLTLDCVEMSLARVFEAGQAYVALSRAKSINSLRVLDFDANKVWANPDVLAFYRKFRRTLAATQIVPVKKSIR